MKEEKSEKSDHPGWYEGLRERLDSLFEDNIPFEAVKELKFEFVLFFGILLYVVYYGLFGYFMWSAYESSSGTKYISLESGLGCSTVPITISGTFLADTDGNWIGKSGFLYSKAAFSLTLTSFAEKNADTYPNMMTTFREAVQTLTTRTEEVGLIYSLVAWMSFVRYYSVEHPTLTTDFESVGFGKLQYLQLTGSPSAVFNLRWTQFALGSQRGVCDAPVDATSNAPLSTLNAQYDWTTFQSSSRCYEAVNTSSFDLYSVQNGVFSVGLDTRSFSTALAVNYGIIQLDMLAPIANTYQNLTVHGVDYTMAQYFDIRYASMDPIACYRNNTPADPFWFHDSQLCFIIKGAYTLGLPLFNHVGASALLKKPEYCTGSMYTDYDCKLFKLMSGILVYPSDETSGSPDEDAELMKKQMSQMISMLINSEYYTYEAFNRAAYNASFIVTASQEPNLEAQYTTETFWNSSFDFCRRNFSDSTSETCSLMMFYQYDYSNNFVSDYHYRLLNYQDDITSTTTDTAWAPIIDTPPVSLKEGYYQCHPTTADTLQNSQGIASGNIDMTMKVLIFILAPVVYFLLYRQNQEPEEEDFHKDHKEELSDMLMNLLLRSMRVAKNAAEPTANDLVVDLNDAGTANGGATCDGNGGAAHITKIKGVNQDGVILKLGEELYQFSQFKDKEEAAKKAQQEGEEGLVIHRCFKKAPKTRGNLLQRAESRSARNLSRASSRAVSTRETSRRTPPITPLNVTNSTKQVVTPSYAVVDTHDDNAVETP